ncbi:anti-sigma factor [Glaciihabitans sp. INWT7]|uniref:anti-sigma factor domain-containing protein n=1 Tax=Glaciihabitans sp. INWT7 TaxID=2596912 RepID=UPI0016248697|nr:anti-sigma factor [Glaciihabitans sp. INWT7]QNE48112.1 anti-sigma factor [Glaciihabitans sp. INWT7]
MNDSAVPDAGHSDPDILAMMAMGEPDIPLADELHVQECPECLDELNSLVRVANLARSGSPLEHPLDAPGPAVWGSISRTLGLATEVMPAPFASAAAFGSAEESEAESSETPVSFEPQPVLPIASRSSGRARRSHRGRNRLVVPVLAGALAVVVSAGAILVATTVLAPKSEAPQPTVLAEARLEALPDWTGASGEAVVEQTGSGRQVVVTLSEPRTAPGYREVWLISSDLSKLISVGVLAGTEGRFTIPADVKLADYPIVDVSSEKPDGNPAHSGDSIVRGTL